MTAVAERLDEAHRLAVHPSGPGNYRITLDGHEIMPTSMRIEFDAAAQHPIATLKLPVFVENLEALAVLDISLEHGDGDPLEEC